MEKMSGSEAKGQGPDKVQVQVLGTPQEESLFKDSGQRPSYKHNNSGFFPVSMALGQGSCLVGSDARNQGLDLEEGHGAQPEGPPPTLHCHVLAHQAEAHNAALCGSWLGAQAACLGQPLASRRCQPEGQRYQGGCLLLSPPGSQARYSPEYTWAGPHCFPGPPGSWDPRAGGQGLRLRPGSRQPQQKPGHQSHYWQGLQGALAPLDQLSLPWGLLTELPGLRERENQGSLVNFYKAKCIY